jgi:integrase
VFWSSIMIDGERKLRSLGTSNRREAERREQTLRDEDDARKFARPELRPEMKVGELYAHFLTTGDVKPHHKDRAKHLLPYFGETRLGDLTKNDVTRYREYRHAGYRANQKAEHPKPLSDATVNRDVAVLRHLLFWAVDEGYIPHNPLTRIRLVRERRQRRPVLPVAHEVKLLSVTVYHLTLLAIVALDTGMRRGELLHQLWEDVDFDRRLLFVTQSKTAAGEKREIPLTSRVLQLLLSIRKPSGLIFTYNGQPIRTVKTAWKAALRRAAIPHYRFHDLRHTFNSRLVECGVIADIRKALMGHSSGGDVHSIYTHVELPLLRKAIASLEGWHTAQLQAHSQPNSEATPHVNHNAPQPLEVL